MLVLTRHRSEKIMIGDDIELVVVDIRGDKVRIGIRAPKETSIRRGELRKFPVDGPDVSQGDEE